jgi:hypothetical protein
VTHANKTMPSFTMGASIRIEDTRLVGGLTAGRVLVLVYAIVMVFVHTEYFEMLPITPVSQGGMVASTLEYSRGGACARAQNAHCDVGGNMCTVITPDELVPAGLVYQDSLYVVTKMDVLTHEKTCTGLVRQGVCIGVCSEAELDRLTVYTEGLEGLRLTHKHSMWDPTVSSGTDEEEDAHAVHHCQLSGRMAMASLAGGACSDQSSELAFANGDLRGGVCFEGDAMTLGQLLRAADSGSGGTKLLGSDGGLRLGVRDSGAAVHVRVKYGNSAHDRDIKYEYQATVLDTDAFASARRSTLDVGYVPLLFPQLHSCANGYVGVVDRLADM